MTRRRAAIILAITLIACALYDAARYADSRYRYGMPRSYLWRLPPQTPWSDKLAVAEMDIAPQIRNLVGVLTLLAVFPRPRLYKLLLLTALLIGMHVAERAVLSYLARHGPIAVDSCTFVGLVGTRAAGPPSRTALLAYYIWLSKSVLLAWLLWFVQPPRARSGHCPRCDYSLAGAVSDRCPECGTHFSPPAVSSNL